MCLDVGDREGGRASTERLPGRVGALFVFRMGVDPVPKPGDGGCDGPVDAVSSDVPDRSSAEFTEASVHPCREVDVSQKAVMGKPSPQVDDAGSDREATFLHFEAPC